MKQLKFFEVRDKGTFIPVLAIGLCGNALDDARERYLARRSGYASDFCVILIRLQCAGTDGNGTYDPYAWDNRTMQVAHITMVKDWPKLKSGDVLDVQFILASLYAIG